MRRGRCVKSECVFVRVCAKTDCMRKARGSNDVIMCLFGSVESAFLRIGFSDL